MKKVVLTFRLDKKEKIIINLQNIDCLDYYDRPKIFLIQNDQKYLLSYDTLRYDMIQLSDFLKKALATELKLHDSIKKDIGYLFNQYSARIFGEKLKEPTFLSYININGRPYWPGNDYLLWSYRSTTWIYNDKDGNIIFEIAPVYPCKHCERKKDPHYISYKKWIKTYKPYLVRIISVETAKQWIEQAESIIKKIEDNVKKFEEEAQGK